MLTTIEVYMHIMHTKSTKNKQKKNFKWGHTLRAPVLDLPFDSLLHVHNYFEFVIDLVVRYISHSTILQVCYYLWVLYEIVSKISK